MKTTVFKLMAMFIMAMALPLNVLAKVAEHGLDVKRLRNWAPKYLTVINNYENMHFENAPSTLRVYSVITAVNGNSTEYMDEAEFHRIIDQPGEIELSYMTKLNGGNKSFTTKLKRRKGYLCFYVSGSDGSRMAHHGYDKHENYHVKIVTMFNDHYDGTKMITDDDVDFFEYSTFDYTFGDESERLEKKNVLSKLARRLEEKGLKHVTEAPDLYIYLTQDVNRNIETVYHPTITSNTDSHTSGGYTASGGGWYNGNFIHYSEGGRGYVNGRSRTVTSETGRIQSYETNDVYLQLSILDAKKIGNKAAPKVWQLTFDKRFDEAVKSSFIEELVMVNAKNYPFGTDSEGYGFVYEYPVYEIGLLIYPKSKERQIVEIIPGSWADQIGIKPGSKVKTYYSRKWNDLIRVNSVGDIYIFLFENGLCKVDGKKKEYRIQPRDKMSFRIDTKGL